MATTITIATTTTTMQATTTPAISPVFNIMYKRRVPCGEHLYTYLHIRIKQYQKYMFVQLLKSKVFVANYV